MPSATALQNKSGALLVSIELFCRFWGLAKLLSRDKRRHRDRSADGHMRVKLPARSTKVGVPWRRCLPLAYRCPALRIGRTVLIPNEYDTNRHFSAQCAITIATEGTIEGSICEMAANAKLQSKDDRGVCGLGIEVRGLEREA